MLRALLVGLCTAVIVVESGCVLRPRLDDRACDEQHPCVTGFTCVEGTCQRGAGAPTPHRDAGPSDGGERDAAAFDGGVPVVEGGCVDEPAADPSWLLSFTLTPEELRPPAAMFTAAWSTVGVDACSLHVFGSATGELPPTGEQALTLAGGSGASLTLRCTAGDEVFEATRVVRRGPGVLQVDARVDRTCVLVEGGVVRCWGVPLATPYPPPVDAPVGDSPGETGAGLPRISLADADGVEAAAAALSLGWGQHDCALLTDGRVKCWGSNGSGQLGLDSTTPYHPTDGYDALPAALLGERSATAVRAGYYTTCASFADGSVGCWGQDAFGQLADGAASAQALGTAPGHMAQLAPFSLDDTAAVVALTGPSVTSCARLDDGTLKCWGSNGKGDLGLGDTDSRGDDDGEVGPALPAVDFGASRTVVDVALAYHSCAVLDDGAVKCWGQNEQGHLGQGMPADGGPDERVGDEPGEMGDALPPVDLGDDVLADRVAVGSVFTCVTTRDRRVKCFGTNGSGRLGLGDTAPRVAIEQLGDALPFTDVGGDALDVAAGTAHACARLADDTVKCWGDNRYGQLGLGDTEDRGDEPGEMGDALPTVDVGPLVPEAFTLAGVERILRQRGCTDCHAAAPTTPDRASPPFDGCDPELVAQGAYDLGPFAADSKEGRRRCLHWHLTEECGPTAPRRGLVDVTRPDFSLLLTAPLCAGIECAHMPATHPTAGFVDRSPGSDYAYLFHWIARGAPGPDEP